MVADGRTANGKWQMADGRWRWRKSASSFQLLASSFQYPASSPVQRTRVRTEGDQGLGLGKVHGPVRLNAPRRRWRSRSAARRRRIRQPHQVEVLVTQHPFFGQDELVKIFPLVGDRRDEPPSPVSSQVSRTRPVRRSHLPRRDLWAGESGSPVAAAHDPALDQQDTARVIQDRPAARYSRSGRGGRRAVPDQCTKLNPRWNLHAGFG